MSVSSQSGTEHASANPTTLRAGMHVLPGGQRRRDHSGAPLTAEARLRILQMLQTTLEPEHLMGLFLGEIQPHCTVDGLQYHVDGITLARAGRTGDGLHAVSYRLVDRDDALGEVLLQRSRPFREEELATLETLLALLVTPLRNGLAYRHAVRTSLADPLTGAGNRAALELHLAHTLRDAQRHEEPLAVLLLDVDRFKQVNDSHGHATGDVVLQRLVTALEGGLRAGDRVFRQGGEEFVVVLPRTGIEDAARIAERLRIMATTVKVPGIPLAVSASFGCAELARGDTVHALLARADDAAYRAKGNGRNTVVASAAPAPTSTA